MALIFLLLTGFVIQATPRFEVASVKLHVQGTGPAMGGVMEMPPSGRVNIVNSTLRALVRASYRLQDYQIIGGPDWLNADRFDIQARPSSDFQAESAACTGAACPPTKVQIMLQGLLADRFQLKTHRETRDLPVYELMPAKGGFKLREVPSPFVLDLKAGPPLPPPPPGTGPPTSVSALPTPPPGVSMTLGTGFAASAVPFSTLTSMLSAILGRPVIDKTRIRGKYDFKLVFSREGLADGAASAAVIGAPTLTASDPRPTIFTALQEEFGLKLESSKGPVEVLVIDSVLKPSEN